MKLKSLGYSTDLIFIRLDGEVLDRGHYLAVRTPDSPNYFWGNLLIFEKPPVKGDGIKWVELFKKEFTDPRIYHMTFGWDTSDVGDVSEFLAQGFKLEKGLVLTATEKDIRIPLRMNSKVKVIPARDDKDWAESLVGQIACGSDRISYENRKSFYTSQLKRYRKFVEMKKGHWFCAILNDRVVASLGVFAEGDVGRFQIVATHPDFQRRGVCATLVYEASQFAFKNMGVKTLVMVVDEEYHAARVYESVGFKPTERIPGLSMWDESRGWN